MTFIVPDVYHYRLPSSRKVLHLLPFENSKNGIVLETLDLLLQTPGSSTSRMTKEFEVLEELRTQVRHCLIVTADCDGLDSLEVVQSHEQVRRRRVALKTQLIPADAALYLGFGSMPEFSD